MDSCAKNRSAELSVGREGFKQHNCLIYLLFFVVVVSLFVVVEDFIINV